MRSLSLLLAVRSPRLLLASPQVSWLFASRCSVILVRSLAGRLARSPIVSRGCCSLRIMSGWIAIQVLVLSISGQIQGQEVLDALSA